MAFPAKWQGDHLDAQKQRLDETLVAWNRFEGGLSSKVEVALARTQLETARSQEQIGIARAAFFPTLLITATGGFEGGSFVDWLSWPNRFWAVGPSALQILFDAGGRPARSGRGRRAVPGTLPEPVTRAAWSPTSRSSPRRPPPTRTSSPKWTCSASAWTPAASSSRLSAAAGMSRNYPAVSVS